MLDAADLAAFVDPDMPGYVLVTRQAGGELPALFSDAPADAFSGIVSGSQPRITCLSSAAVVYQEMLTILGRAYRVIDINPKGGLNGLSTCVLELQ